MTHGALHVSAIALGAAAFLAMSPLSTASADSPAPSASVSAPSGAALPSAAPAPAPGGENATGSVAASTPSAPAPSAKRFDALARRALADARLGGGPCERRKRDRKRGRLDPKRAGARAKRFDALARRARADARLGGGPCERRKRDRKRGRLHAQARRRPGRTLRRPRSASPRRRQAGPRPLRAVRPRQAPAPRVTTPAIPAMRTMPGATDAITPVKAATPSRPLRPEWSAASPTWVRSPPIRSIASRATGPAPSTGPIRSDGLLGAARLGGEWPVNSADGQGGSSGPPRSPRKRARC